MKISIVIPFHNEEIMSKETLTKVSEVMKKTNYDYEILAIDDNSNDNTANVVSKLIKKNKKIRLIRKINKKSGPSGLGSALRFGFKNSLGDIIVVFMGDLSDNPKDIPKMINKAFDGFDVVCGSRFIKGSRVDDYPIIKLICNRLYNRLFSLLFNIPTVDISNGFKVYKRKVIETTNPESTGFEITSEIVLKARIKNFKIAEVPVSWSGKRKGGESKFGSFISPSFIFFKLPKIGLKYGVPSLILWLKFILTRIRREKK